MSMTQWYQQVGQRQERMPWFCPYCGKEKPDALEPAQFACCGEIGHATQEDEDEQQQ